MTEHRVSRHTEDAQCALKSRHNSIQSSWITIATDFDRKTKPLICFSLAITPSMLAMAPAVAKMEVTSSTESRRADLYKGIKKAEARREELGSQLPFSLHRAVSLGCWKAYFAYIGSHRSWRLRNWFRLRTEVLGRDALEKWFLIIQNHIEEVGVEERKANPVKSVGEIDEAGAEVLGYDVVDGYLSVLRNFIAILIATMI
ncbi:hypothetical protein FRC02_009604 [Tulasnella sp. 418]|nr:hypothetical protein FRC02_009604 [Tulasnella sp. 418]